MKHARGRLLVACLAVAGSAVAVAGGSAGNRVRAPTLEAVPGPGAVTYGENIAYKATFSNDGGSTFTQTKFMMAPPVIGTARRDRRFVTSCGTFDSSGVLTCDFGQPDRPARSRGSRSSGSPGRRRRSSSCTGTDCLIAEETWLIKEGKTTNGNETFPAAATAR